MSMATKAQAHEPHLIEIDNLHKRYGRRRILKGVNFRIAEGHAMALLGNNGAGKTTLMRLIAGLAKPDKGEIKLGGAIMQRAGYELRRYVGFVGHSPLLYENLTCLENLRFFAQLYDLHEADTRIESLLKAVDLWTRRHDLVRTFSRGMLQRLAIARAVLHDPPILLLDEPDTGLDQASISLLQDLIQLLGSGKRSILFSTHSLENALAWSAEIALLADGQIASVQPAHRYTIESLRSHYSDNASS